MPGQYFKKTSRLFNPADKSPFKLSRSKIDLFIECPRCFYLDRRLGVQRPAGFPFNLNSAVDALLKKEFDIHRDANEPHPLMKAYGVDAVPFSHKDLDAWRENFTGVQFLHKETNLLITGAVDDVWVNRKKELFVVDYKATSKDSEVNIDAEWQDGYKRQMEVYQWLLRQNGFKVSDTGYFVYANGKRDRKAFDGRLEFDIKLIPYTGSDKWIAGTLNVIKKCLVDPRIPMAGKNCEYCGYTDAVATTLEEKKREKPGETKSIKKVKKSPIADQDSTLF